MDINQAPEIEALRMGMDWDRQLDLLRPHILIETTERPAIRAASAWDSWRTRPKKKGSCTAGQALRFTVTDICDGIAQGHEGHELFLLSRDIIAAMNENPLRVNIPDGMLFLSSCDKALPAHLVAAARARPSHGRRPRRRHAGRQFRPDPRADRRLPFPIRPRRDRQDLPFSTAKARLHRLRRLRFMGYRLHHAGHGRRRSVWRCPFPPSPPSSSRDRLPRPARPESRALLVEERASPRATFSPPDAFYNAAVVHAAISGSTNALYICRSSAREAGVDFGPAQFDRIGRSVPYLCDIRPAGRFSAEYFWYAGGRSALLLELGISSSSTR